MATRKSNPRRRKPFRKTVRGKTSRFSLAVGNRPTARGRRSSTAGKILPPLDVRTPRHLKEFEKRIKKGPITIIMVYADWCGHCHTMMPHFDAAAKSPNRSIQAVKVNDTMLEKVNETVNKNINQVAKPLNVEGYPSIIVVDNKGNKVTDLEPVRNTDTMKSIMENAGPLAENAGLANSANENPNEVVASVVKKDIVNLSKNIKPKSLTLANVGVENVGPVSLRKNINVGEDELKGSIASEPNTKKNLKLKALPAANLANAGLGLNNKKPTKEVAAEELAESIAPSPINAFSAPKSNKNKVTAPVAPAKEFAKEAEEITSLAAPITPPSISSDISESISNKLTPEQKIGGGSNRRGGSLISALTTTTYKLAPTAALLATAAYVIRGKKGTRRRTIKNRKTHKRRDHRRS
jgi:thiol-disulfide isomerase/thioredoxin